MVIRGRKRRRGRKVMKRRKRRKGGNLRMKGERKTHDKLEEGRKFEVREEAWL